MATEESPLLPSEPERQAVLKHDAVYDRFSPSRKRVIIAVTALTGSFPSMFASSTDAQFSWLTGQHSVCVGIFYTPDPSNCP